MCAQISHFIECLERSSPNGQQRLVKNQGVFREEAERNFEVIKSR